MVTIELSAGITASSQNERQFAVVYRNCTVGELLAEAGVNLRDVGMILVNKKLADLQCTVADRDHIHVLGMLCGG